MNLVGLQTEIELDERELSQLRAQLADDEWVERTAGAIVTQQRLRVHELGVRLEQHRRQLAGGEVVQGGLPSPYVGTWVPLALYEDGDVGVARQPLVVDGPKLDDDARAQFARQLAKAVRNNESWGRVASEILKTCGDDVPTLRLIAAALSRHQDFAHHVRQKLQQLGVTLPSAMPRRLTRNDVSDSREPPALSDGLTTLQRLVLSVMRDLAPSNGSFVAPAIIAAEVNARDAAVEPGEVEHVLIELCHPLLRLCPLIEFRGLTRRRSPGQARVDAVRLADFAVDYLEGRLALPLLLINGGSVREALMPGHNPTEIFDLAMYGLDHSLHDLSQMMRRIQGPDFATGGVVHGRGTWNFHYENSGELRLRAELEVQFDQHSDRGRVVVSKLPWPMRPADVIHNIEALRTQGHFDGVTAIRDESTAEQTEIVLDLEHLVFGEPTIRALIAGGLVERSFQCAFEVSDGVDVRTVHFNTLVQYFLEQRKARVRQQLSNERDAMQARAALAEAVVVALEIIEPVQAVMRAAFDDAESVTGLMNFPKTEHRSVFAAFRVPLSHDYKTGFTEAQARHLVKQRKLAQRPRDAARREWLDLREECARLATSDSIDLVNAHVRQELRAAKERFGAPRRTRVLNWD